MARRLALFLLVASLLAGCMDDARDDDGTSPNGTPPDPNGGNPEPPTSRAYGARPLWFAGLQYQYEATFPGADVSGPIDITVLGVEGAFELTGNASDDVVMWALFHHLPPLGPVEPGTLNPIIHGVPVGWFDFPLSDGKTWSAPDHHGTAVNYTTRETTVTVPGGRTVPAFEVVGERGGVTWVRYTYTAEIGWFTSIDVDGSGDGEVDARMTLRDARVEPNHARLETFRPHALAVHTAYGIASLPNEASTFTIEPHHTDVFVYFVMFGGPGHYSGFVTLPGEPPLAPLPGMPSRQYNWTNTEDPGSMVFADEVDPTPGDGTVGGVPLTQDGGVYAEVMAVERVVRE